MPSYLLGLVVLGICVCGFLGGVLLTLGLTGGSLRCMVRGHGRSSQIWICRDSSGVGYSCPRCRVLWIPSDPFDQLQP